MSIKRKIFDTLFGSVLKVARVNRANKLTCAIAEKIDPVHDVRYKGERYVISCPNTLTNWRAETYFTKEPETIEWIDTFQKGDVLFDVGANIGLYSIYAAKRGVRVVAFEPESQNYALINKNIFLNGCSDTAMALNIALSDKDCVDYLNISQYQAGCAVNCFQDTVDWKYEKFTPHFRQGVLSYTLDSFLGRYSNCFPSHIKIDVDGLEPKIMKGAQSTLKDRRLKSISLEINEALSENLEMVAQLQGYGFHCAGKKHADMFEGGEYTRCFNYLFRRESRT